jgi:RNA polymerase-binding transcription factor DksA
MKKLDDLKERRKNLEERIRHLEADLKSPRSQDPDDDAVVAKNRDILYGLYQIEKNNLSQIDAEMAKFI